MAEEQYPEPIAAALIFNQDNKIFLVNSPRWEKKYSIPGGHVELGESIEQALKREIKEETNLDIFDIEFLQIQEFIFGKEYYKKKHFIFIEYICRTKNTNVILDEEEGEDYVWVSVDEALKLSLNSYVKSTILKYKEKYLN